MSQQMVLMLVAGGGIFVIWFAIWIYRDTAFRHYFGGWDENDVYEGLRKVDQELTMRENALNYWREEQNRAADEESRRIAAMSFLSAHNRVRRYRLHRDRAISWAFIKGFGKIAEEYIKDRASVYPPALIPEKPRSGISKN
ncbi:MAG: hypothetical protein HYT40_01420 [Candidatus Sungbacteria bacterium]|uniref:Uncharacterized protein n=1 Tax=Candidatus Sungiibacteriota bacterium TaxID=2750080 RepID=A0A931SB89_9BACT|nr:hypothetical protein [Candidatus Sungbacteria bacterium]